MLVLEQLGRLELAEKELRTVLQLDPERAEVAARLGKILMKQGRIREALEMWDTAPRQRQPNDVLTLNLAAWYLATSPDAALRNGKQAVEFAERAARLCKSAEPTILDTLAAAYAEAGRFDDAIRTEEKALELPSRKGQDKFDKELRNRLKQYQQGKPFRELRDPGSFKPHPSDEHEGEKGISSRSVTVGQALCA